MKADAVASTTGPRRPRADAARNRQRLIEAAAEVFAARGLDATLDDIARHAGVNVATAYRHFANKQELAREFLLHCIDRSVAIAEEAAAHPDPWTGLTQFLERSLEMMASNRALVDVLTRAHGGEHFAELITRTTAPLDRLLTRCREARVVRADIAAITAFCDQRLGKAVVPSNDTPNFIANRVGTFSMLNAIRLIRHC